MIIRCSPWPSPFCSAKLNTTLCSGKTTRSPPSSHVAIRSDASSASAEGRSHGGVKRVLGLEGEEGLPGIRLCSCGRRHFVEALATTALIGGVRPSIASGYSSPDSAMLNKFHPQRPHWYEQLQAFVLDKGMKRYEAEIAEYKAQLFGKLKGKVKEVLEIGIGTGPNLKYYADNNDIHVIGLDPKRIMEKYAQAAAVEAGLAPANFQFLQAVGEAMPLGDASVDAVIGTLVLCSVSDVEQTLNEVKRVLKPDGMYLFVEHVAAKDGTPLKLLQSILDPLQQAVADGCHLTRETGKNISEAGFATVELSTAFLSNAPLINSHIYGIAKK